MDKIRRKYHLVTFGFLGLSLLIYTGFFVLPTIMGFFYSLTNWDGITATISFIGLKNYREVFSDQRFFSSVFNTLYLTVVQCIFFNAGALVLAAIIESRSQSPIKGLLRSLYFIPYVLSFVVTAVMWNYMLSFRSGVINEVLRFIGLEALAQDWLGSPDLVMSTIAFVNLWAFSGFYFVTYMSSIQAIPREMYESAAIDGAGKVSSFFKITIPMVAPSFTVNAVVSVAWGLATFEPIALMTKGGPGFASETISYYIYWAGFLGARQGYGSALSVLLFAVTLCISILQLKLLRKREVQL